MQESLNIADLPSDIIRKIMMIGNESVHGMRLISHRWNAFAVVHLSDRNRYPVIYSVYWAKSKDNYKIFIRTATRNENYFNLTAWDVLRESEQIGEYRLSLRRSNTNEKYMSKFLDQVFKRCARIEKLGLSRLDLRILTISLNKVIIDEMVLLDKAHVEGRWGQQLLISNNVQCLVLTIDGRLWDESFLALREYLSFAIKHANSVEIRINNISNEEMRMDNYELKYWEDKVIRLANLITVENFTAKLYETVAKVPILRIRMMGISKRAITNAHNLS